MKKNHAFILGFYFLLTTACSGNSLVSEVEVDASVSDVADHSLSVAAVHSGTPDVDGNYPDYLADDGTKIFQNDLGYIITLEKAGISWEHFHLISEGDDEDCEAGNDAEIELMYVENLFSNDLEAATLVTDLIADAAYCQYEIHFSPENEESAGIDDFSEMAGNTIYVSGSWSHDGESGTFEIAVDDEIEVTGVFMASEEGELIEHPLHFHDGEDSTSVTFGNYYDRFFDGIDFSESNEELGFELIENLRNTFYLQSI